MHTIVHASARIWRSVLEEKKAFLFRKTLFKENLNQNEKQEQEDSWKIRFSLQGAARTCVKLRQSVAVRQSCGCLLSSSKKVSYTLCTFRCAEEKLKCKQRSHFVLFRFNFPLPLPLSLLVHVLMQIFTWSRCICVWRRPLSGVWRRRYFAAPTWVVGPYCTCCILALWWYVLRVGLKEICASGCLQLPEADVAAASATIHPDT